MSTSLLVIIIGALVLSLVVLLLIFSYMGERDAAQHQRMVRDFEDEQRKKNTPLERYKSTNKPPRG